MNEDMHYDAFYGPIKILRGIVEYRINATSWSNTICPWNVCLFFCIGLFGLSLVLLFIYILMGFDYFKKQEDNYTAYILIHSL